MSIQLTQSQQADYDELGYIVVKSLYNQQELDTFLNRLDQIITGEVDRAEKMLVMKDVMVAKGKVQASTPQEKIAKLQDFNDDEVLSSYYKQEGLLDHVSHWCGDNVKMIHNMLINKPPNVDGRHPMHQDLLYFPFRPVDKIIGTWTALETVNRENGCLAVIPGSHKAGVLYDHGMPEDSENINFAYFGVKDLDLSNRVHLEMEPGDTVFFHPLLVHGSGVNKSKGFRRAISAHFAACECVYNEKGEGGLIQGSGKDFADIRHYELVKGQEVAGGI